MTSKGFSHQDVPSSQAESSNSWNSESRNLLSVMTSSLVTSNLNPKPSASGKVTIKAKSYVLNPCKDSNNLSLHNDPFQCPWRHQCHCEQPQAQQSLGEGGTCLSLPAWEHHGWRFGFSCNDLTIKLRDGPHVPQLPQHGGHQHHGGRW